MEAFYHSVNLKSRADCLHIYVIGDVHYGAPNCDKDRLSRYVRAIKNDKAQKVVFLLGDICDLVVMRDQKRFTSANLDDETLTGSPRVIRKNLSNIAVTQMKRVAKMLARGALIPPRGNVARRRRP